MRRAIAVAAFMVIAGAPTIAQKLPTDSGFVSREQFFAAGIADVRRMTGATSLTDSSTLDSLVRHALPTLVDFFNLTPDVFWAVDGQGSFSHPDGIGIDRHQLLGLKQKLGLEAYLDLIDFVLAHEFAHVAQFNRQDSEVLIDPSNVHALECEADIWAGIHAYHVLRDSLISMPSIGRLRPVDVPESVAGVMERLLNAIAVAYEVGHPDWYETPGSHPTRLQRRACALRGVVIGQQLGLVRDYAVERDSTVRRHYADQVTDEALFRGEDGAWAVTWEHATRLTALRTVDSVTTVDPPPTVRIIARLLSAAAVSGDSLRRVVGQEEMTGLLGKCTLETSATTTIWSCRYVEAVWSMQMFDDFWTGLYATIRAAIELVGWETTRRDSRPSWFAEWAPPGIGSQGIRTGGLAVIQGNNNLPDRSVWLVVTARERPR